MEPDPKPNARIGDPTPTAKELARLRKVTELESSRKTFRDVFFAIVVITFIISFATRFYIDSGKSEIEVVYMKDGTPCAIVNKEEVLCDVKREY